MNFNKHIKQKYLRVLCLNAQSLQSSERKGAMTEFIAKECQNPDIVGLTETRLSTDYRFKVKPC